MSSSSPSSPGRSSSWPTILLFIAAIGVPGSAALAFSNAISKNPWQVAGIALLAEIAVLIVAFLRKVWQHLEEEWSKDTATWVDNLVKRKWFSYSSYYCRFLTFQHRDFDVKGLSTQSIYTLELEQVFVDLSIDPKQLHEVASSSLHVQVPQDLLSKNHSLWTYLAADVLKNQQVVVLGAPGSGKTTLLKHLALTLANQKKKQVLSRPLRRLYKLPFLLFLREHAKAIQENPHFSLVDAVEDKLGLWEREVPQGWARRQLSKGGCLILLDGLDEVADVATRKQVVKWVEQQMITYGKNRFIITSRPFGYRSNPLGGVMVLEARPFTFSQIQQFVQNWYRTNEIMSSQKDDPGVRMRANAGAQDLLRRIQQTATLASLAVNPLLLTMIATIHRYRSTLPGKRVELYAEICDVFLGKRQQARDIEVALTPAQCRAVLQPLAYEMMVRQSREILANEAQEIIEEPLRLVHEQMTTEDFLHMIENISGLLLEREQGIYSFAHLTFQEYLAAIFICEQQQEVVLVSHIGESSWAETIRLYCAQTNATTIVNACLKDAPFSVAHLILALECYEEAHQVQPTLKPQIDTLLEHGAEDIDAARRNVVAEALLRRRLKEMVFVREGVYRDTSLLTHVEYQLFVDEQRDLGFDFHVDYWKNGQFPPGHALQPVVGVRPSDSEAFCRWLTQRESGVWTYRLPRLGEHEPEEVQRQPSWLRSQIQDTPIGYWDWKGKAYTFEQVRWQARGQSGIIPSEVDTVKPLNLDLSDNNDHAQVVSLAKTVETYSYFSFYVNLACASGLVSNFTHTRDLDSDLARASDLVSDLAHASDLGSDLAYTSNLADASNLALDLALSSDFAIIHASDLALVHAGIDFIQTNDLTSDLIHAFALIGMDFIQANGLANDLNHAFDHVCNFAEASRLVSDLAYTHVSDLTSNFTRMRDITQIAGIVRISDIVRDLAQISDLALDLACASEKFLALIRVETDNILPIAKLLALLSICVSFSAYELSNRISNLSAFVWWKPLLSANKKKNKKGKKTDIQQILNKGIGIHQKIERLEKRIQGEEYPCEGILIVKERKGTP